MTKRTFQIAILATTLAGAVALTQTATAAAQQHGTGTQPPAATGEPFRPDIRVFEDVNVQKAVLGQYDPLKRRIERLRDLKTAEALDRAKDAARDGQRVD